MNFSEEKFKFEEYPFVNTIHLPNYRWVRQLIDYESSLIITHALMYMSAHVKKVLYPTFIAREIVQHIRSNTINCVCMTCVRLYDNFFK